MFTLPVLDDHGRMIAMLAGSLDLLGENFLGRLAGVRIGNEGYLYLFSPDGTILMHPDRTRILREKVPIDIDRLFDQAAKGLEGSGETVNFDGLPVFSSFKRLSSTHWVLATDYPTAEAFAPVNQALRYFWAGLGVVLACSVLFVWLFMRHLTAPLLRMTNHVRDLIEGKTELLPMNIDTRDEIGILAGAFNRLEEESAQQTRTIQEQKEFAVDLLENAAAPIFVLDAEHRVLIWNRACAELTGLSAAAVKGTNQQWRAFYDQPRPCLADFVLEGSLDQLPRYYDVQDRSRLVDNGLCAEGWRTMPAGSRRYLIFNAAPIRNGAGDIVAAIETLEDITERKQTEKQMEYLAHFDPLTGMPNRLLFFDHLAREMAAAARYGYGLGLLFLDLDGFKVVNDTVGHDAGDRVLVEVAERLKNCVRTCDMVARMGGDEFTILLSRAGTAPEARLVVERIQQAFSVPFIVEGQSFAVGTSIGISLYPLHGGVVDTLVKMADTAMYAAKGEGSNLYRFAEEKAESQA
jgi:diguanylate cyclase (GGDEF)-like protein